MNKRNPMTTAKISHRTRIRLGEWKRYLAVIRERDLSIDDVITIGLDALGDKHPTAQIEHREPELA